MARVPDLVAPPFASVHILIIISMHAKNQHVGEALRANTVDWLNADSIFATTLLSLNVFVWLPSPIRFEEICPRAPFLLLLVNQFVNADVQIGSAFSTCNMSR